MREIAREALEIKDRMKYGREWKNISLTEEGRILDCALEQSEGERPIERAREMIAEWINENFDIFISWWDEMQAERITEKARVSTSLYNDSIYLKISHDPKPYLKKSYGKEEILDIIYQSVENFLVNNNLLTRGALHEVNREGVVNPNRLRGIDDFIYEELTTHLGRKYLDLIEERMRDVEIVRKDDD